MTLLVKPAPRWKAFMCELPTSSELVLYGGQTTASQYGGVYSYGGILGDYWSFNGTSFSLLGTGANVSGNTLTSPTPRFDMAASFDGTFVSMVGGSDSHRNLSSTHSYNTSGGWIKQALTETIENPIGSPPSYGLYPIPTLLSGASMAYQSGVGGGECVLFGGESSSQRRFSLDTWIWNSSTTPGTWTLLSPTTWPVARKWSAMASSATIAVLFGGCGNGNSNYLSDTIQWSGSNWSVISTGQTPGVSSPAARYGHSMAYNASNSEYILFGGCLASGELAADTWSYSTSTNKWTQISTGIGSNFPVARAFASMAYLTGTTSVYLFGGKSAYTGLNDLWQLNASNQWILIG